MLKKDKKIKIQQQLTDVYDYFKVDKKIKDYFKNKEDVNAKKIKIAVLSSFTFRGIEEVLRVKCFQCGINTDFFVGGYNQYSQEILNENGELYNFFPDIIFIFIDTNSFFGDEFYFFNKQNSQERKKVIKEKISDLGVMIAKIEEKLSAKIVLHNFCQPIYSPMGIIENKQDYGVHEAINDMNRYLIEAGKSDQQLFIYDFNTFVLKHGWNNIFDYKLYYLGDVKINTKVLPDLCEEYMGYIKPLLSLIRKCLVLDLDNTLWGGVIGEEGLKGIKLGPDPEGRPFLEFQKYIKSLYQRGIILAINSKNNEGDVREVLKKHPYMILNEDYFATMKINWLDKASNIRSIAEELNIGLDSIVFIDDDKLNREMVKDELPEVQVIDLPEDFSQYLKTISEINDFNVMQITEEDSKKGEMYAQQRKRNDLSKKCTNIEDYLKRLKMIATIDHANEFNISRISQLTQKTNQFNMTTRRYLEEDIVEMLNKKYFIFLIGVKDKFGDNGITGVVIAEKKDNVFRIDNFLLSCRIIGRNIEKIMLAYIIEKAREENIEEIIGEFIQSEKNYPAKTFYKDHGFELVEKRDEFELWRYRIINDYPYIDYIKVIK